MTGRHRPAEPPPRPPRLTDRQRRLGVDTLIGLALGLPVAAVIAAAVQTAPDGTRSARRVALPTPVEKTLEPSGKGGPIALPTFATEGQWTEDKGPVIVNGQALARPPAITTAPVKRTSPAPASSEPAQPVDDQLVGTPPVTTTQAAQPAPVVLVPLPTRGRRVHVVTVTPTAVDPQPTPTATPDPTTTPPAEPTPTETAGVTR